MTKTQTLKAFGIVIKKFRTQNHLTQKQLAQKIGASQTYISKIEQGTGNPTIQSIVSLALALNTKIEPILRKI